MIQYSLNCTKYGSDYWLNLVGHLLAWSHDCKTSNRSQDGRCGYPDEQRIAPKPTVGRNLMKAPLRSTWDRSLFVMHLNTRGFNLKFWHYRLLVMLLAVLGILHFGVSLLVWYAVYTNGHFDDSPIAFTPGYFVPHVGVPIILLLTFLVAAYASFSRTRWYFLPTILAYTLAILAFEVETQYPPQFQKIWWEQNRACSSREDVYCTWFTYHRRIRLNRLDETR